MKITVEQMEAKLEYSQKVLQYLNKATNTVAFNRKREWGGGGLKLNAKSELFLYRIDEVTFEEKAPRREAMENVLATFRGIEGFNFIYMIIGDKTHVDFYFGVATDKSYSKNNVFYAKDIAEGLLKPAIKGNFRGSKISDVSEERKKEILNQIQDAERFGLLEGVPGVTEESDQNNTGFQSVERLIDVMLGEKFGFVVVANPCSYADIDRMKNDLYEVYDLLMPLTRYTMQSSKSKMSSVNISDSYAKSTQTGISTQNTESENHSETNSKNSDFRNDQNNQIQSGSTESANRNFDQVNERSSHTKSDGGSSRSDSKSSEIAYSESKSDGINNSKSYSNTYSESMSNSINVSGSKNWSNSESNSTSESYSENWNRSDVTGENNSFACNEQIEVGNKNAMYWLEYIDKILLPRIDNGCGKGVFKTCVYMFSDKKVHLHRLANTAISLFSAEKGNQNALRFYELDNPVDEECKSLLQNMQIPTAIIDKDKENRFSVVVSHCVNEETVSCANWYSANEVTVIAGLPQKDVVGLSLRQEVDFGLNVTNKIEEENRIKIGSLVQCGDVTKIPFYLDSSNLDKHTFIAGVTGSGKTTTCHKILIDSKLPFLVIEPAKTEYRILKNHYPDLIVFTPGRQDVAPFYLNPFELFPGEAITSRADMLKATMEASFDMDAAIPQLLEAAIYRVYEDKGWNIGDNTWNGKSCEEACADGVYAFPTLSDFIQAAITLVDEQGFDDRLKDAYKGSIKARLQGLLVGAKGMMLNTYRSVDFSKLIEKKVVIELEEIRNGTEKSLLMGFIITNLLEALKYKHRQNPEFQHITLVEEAHRLLSNYSPGDSMNKKQGVEVFADMLAEVRKYRESLIIVDQIPNKMTPEVLKNTNTKIVHRLFAQDDKDAIGNTMALEKEQKEFLSNLVPGRAIVFTQGLTKAIQVQIENETNTTGAEVDPKEITELAINYYFENYKRGVLRGLEHIDNVTTKTVEDYLKLQLSERLLSYCRQSRYRYLNEVFDFVEDMPNLRRYVKEAVKICSKELVIKYFYWNTNENMDMTGYKKYVEFFDAILDEKILDDSILARMWITDILKWVKF